MWQRGKGALDGERGGRDVRDADDARRERTHLARGEVDDGAHVREARVARH